MKRPRGTGSVFRRGRVWWTWLDGKGESTKSTNKQVAIDRIKERMKGAAARPLPGAAGIEYADLEAMLLKDMRALKRRSVDNVEKFRLPYLLAYFGRMRAAEIEHDHVNGYIIQRTAEKASAATVRYEVQLLRRMLALAVKNRKLTALPAIPSITVDNARSGFCSPEEIEKVITALPAHAKPIVRALYLTGWRTHEILDLEWRRVDLDAGTFRLDTSKTGKPRVFPYGALPALADVIRSQRELTSAVEKEQSRVVARVFHIEGEPIGSIRTAWRTATKAAGLPGLTLHDLRRSGARNLCRAGVSDAVVMKLCGWRTRSMWDRYNIVDGRDLEQGVAQLDGFLRNFVSFVGKKKHAK